MFDIGSTMDNFSSVVDVFLDRVINTLSAFDESLEISGNSISSTKILTEKVSIPSFCADQFIDCCINEE